MLCDEYLSTTKAMLWCLQIITKREELKTCCCLPHRFPWCSPACRRCLWTRASGCTAPASSLAWCEVCEVRGHSVIHSPWFSIIVTIILRYKRMVHKECDSSSLDIDGGTSWTEIKLKEEKGRKATSSRTQSLSVLLCESSTHVFWWHLPLLNTHFHHKHNTQKTWFCFSEHNFIKYSPENKTLYEPWGSTKCSWQRASLVNAAAF